jgi:hypothetical protein
VMKPRQKLIDRLHGAASQYLDRPVGKIASIASNPQSLGLAARAMTEIHPLNFSHDSESTSYPAHGIGSRRSSGRDGYFDGLTFAVLGGVERRRRMALGLERCQAGPHIFLCLEMVLRSMAAFAAYRSGEVDAGGPAAVAAAIA